MRCVPVGRRPFAVERVGPKIGTDYSFDDGTVGASAASAVPVL